MTARGGPAIENIYPLSPMQQGMLFHSIDAGDAAVYFEQCRYDLDGPLDAAILRESWRRIIARHAVLRTGFSWKQGTEPLQIVHREARAAWSEEDWRDAAPETHDARLAERMAIDRATPFDLTRPPLMRFLLIRLTDTRHVFVWSFHHILLDGWSIQLLTRELGQVYGAQLKRERPALPAVRPFADYIAWLRAQDAAAAERFWRAALDGLREPTRLDPGGDARAGAAATTNLLVRAALPAEETARVSALARQARVTPGTCVQAAWALLLQMYARVPDVVFGVTVAGRPPDLDGVERMIGLFVNTLPLRVRVTPGRTVRAWLAEIQVHTVDARQYDYAPLAHVQRWAGAIPSGTALFDTLLVIENYPEGTADRSGTLGIANLDFFERTNYRLCAYAEFGATVGLQLRCTDPAIDGERLSGLLAHWRQMLVALAADPDRAVDEIPLTSDRERERVLDTWNVPDTVMDAGSEAAPLPPAATLLDLLRHAPRDDRSIAVRFEHQTLTGPALDARANRWAHLLRARGVAPEVRVGVCLDRSLDFVVALVAIVKAGGVFVPLDPAQPAARLAFMAADADVAAIVTTRAGADRLAVLDREIAILCMDDPDLLGIVDQQSGSEPAVDVIGSHAAYTLYTSGSTGKPKGVVNTQEGIVNRVRWMVGAYAITPADRVLQKTPCSFDVSVWELFVPLAAGATLVLARPDGHRDSRYLAGVVADAGVTILHFVPSMLQAFVEEPDIESAGATVRLVACSGEALPAATARRLHDRWPHARIVNLYGPTEAAVEVTAGEFTVAAAGAGVTMGRPIAGTRMYVLDAYLRPMPIGVPGELFIGGVQVARGYIGQPGRTADRFVPDPFADRPGPRLYRTGDLACWSEAGHLEFLGRLDHQVKLRGYRIEPGEIEAAIAAQPGIERAAVIVREEAGRPLLAAYVVPPDAASATGPSLRERLAASLPDYMVPAVVIGLRELPLTVSGKVDRRALAALPWTAAAAPSAAGARTMPETGAEAVLAGIWAAVLGVPAVGIDDNFFALGGDSILCIQIASRALRAGWRVTPRMVFQHPTVRTLAAAAAPEAAAVAPAAPHAVDARWHPLHPVQTWFVEQRLEQAFWWNQWVWLDVPGEVDMGALRGAFASVQQRHAAWRLRFAEREGVWRQREVPREEAEVCLEVDLRGLPPNAQTPAIASLTAQAQASLDLHDGPVARVIVFRLAGASGRVLLIAHHLAVDVVSWQVVMPELRRAYDAARRGDAAVEPPPSTSYTAWAERLDVHRRSAELQDEAAYWRDALAGPSGAIAPDHEHGSNREGDVAEIEWRLDADESATVFARAADAYRLRVHEVVLTALARVLANHAAAPAVVIDVEGHGREEVWPGIDLSRTVGWCTSIYPVRLAATGAWGPVLTSIKEQLRAVPHGGLGYGLLCRSEVPAVRDTMARLPRAAVCFNYLGRSADAGTSEAADRTDAAARPGAGRSPRASRAYEIEIAAGLDRHGLWMTVGYSAARYRPETMAALIAPLRGAFADIAAYCARHRGHTPSDFPQANLAAPALDALIDDLGLTPGGLSPRLEDIYPLVPMQAGILFDTLEAPHSGVYFEQSSSTLDDLDWPVFRAAWQHLVARHAVLRTSFEWKGVPEPLQVVHREVELPWEEEDWRGRAAADQQRDLAVLLTADRRAGFDLSRAPLMRFRLIRLDERSTQVIWSHHHLLLDGWSSSRLVQELVAAYEALAAGRAIALPATRRYADYVTWCRSRDLTAAERFWREQLAGVTAPTQLVLPRARTPQGPAPRLAAASLPLDVSSALRDAARRHRCTVNTIIQGAWALLLHDYSGADDVVFGAIAAGRPPELAGSDTMIGLFINTLPVRARVVPEAPVAAWLQGLLARQAETRQYDYAPFARIQSWSGVPQGAALCDTLLLVQNHPGGGAGTSRVLSKATETVFERTSFRFAAYAAPGDRITLRLVCTDGETTAAVLEGMAEHWATLLRGFAGEHVVLGAIPRISPAQREQVLTVWNRPAGRVWPGLDTCLLAQRIEMQAARHPDAIALRRGDAHVTYDAMNRRANRLAHTLRADGARPDALIGVCIERAPELVIGLLAVLKSGAAYVPIDPAYPAERLAHIARDSRAPVLLTTRALKDVMPQLDAVVRYADQISSEVEDGVEGGGSDAARDPRAGNPAPDATLDHLIYAIYTSGSTGSPKAAAVTRGGFANLMRWFIDDHAITAADRPLVLSSPSFDLTQKNIWAPLLVGGTLELASRTRFEPRAMIDDVDRTQATVIACAPSLLYEMAGALDEDRPDSLRSLRAVFLGGEPIDAGRLRPWTSRPGHHAAIVNAYGPAETTDISNARILTAEDLAGETVITIGPPLRQAASVIVDRQGHLLPAGIVGEIAIAGWCVGRGYLGRPGLTADRFAPNPEPSLGSDRLYRTGDLGRWLPHGEIECLGRRDHQIKVRGVRVELGEIEACLRRHPAIVAAAVAAHGDGAALRLAAYVVSHARATLDEREVRRHLASMLPDAMVPSAIVELSALPINAHGKLDRLALAAMGVDPALAPHPSAPPARAGGEPREALTELERGLMRLWEAVLHRRGICVTDDFFELGGHSLAALSLVARIEREFGREVPIATFLAARSIRALARFVSGADRSSVSPLHPIQPAVLDGAPAAPPLFCVHPGSGNVLCYTDLAAALGREAVVIGLQDPNVMRDDYQHATVEGLAALYVDAIRAQQPHGPYQLLGWSFGGHVAFEMACRLEALGEEVRLLALLDTAAASLARLGPTGEDSASLLEVLGRDLGLDVRRADLDALPVEAQIDHVTRLGQAAGLEYHADPRRFLRRQMRIFRARLRAMREYQPGRSRCAITVFRAADDDGELPVDAPDFDTFGWAPLTAGRVDMHFVPGAHATLARPPHVRTLASRLRPLLSPSATMPVPETLSAAQVDRWLQDQWEPGRAPDRMNAARRIRGPLDVRTLARAFEDVLNAHGALRVAAVLDPHAAGLRIVPVRAGACALDVRRAGGSDDPIQAARDLVDEHAAQPFDLAAGPLVRARVIAIGDDDHVLSIVAHRFAIDVRSLRRLPAEILWRAGLAGDAPLRIGTTPVPAAAASAGIVESPGADDDVTPIPLDRPRPASPRYRGIAIRCPLDLATTAAARTIARRYGATDMALFLACAQVLLARLSGRDTVLAGLVVGAASTAAAASLAGDRPFTEIMREADVALRMDIAGERQASGRPHRPWPLCCVFDEAIEKSVPGSPVAISAFAGARQIAEHDLTLTITRGIRGSRVGLIADADLFEPATVRRIARLYATIVRQACTRTERPACEFARMTAGERRRQLRRGNGDLLSRAGTPGGSQVTDAGGDATVLAALARHALSTPDATAAVCGGRVMRYGELERLSARMARALHRLGVRPGDSVALCAPRDLPMLVAMLAVLKSGAVYVPLDPVYPDAQLALMLASADARYLLVAPELASRCAALTVPCLVMDDDGLEGQAHWRMQEGAGQVDGRTDEPRALPALPPGAPAYVMFTSGSTGAPKGVVIPHGGLTHHLWAKVRALGLGASDVVAETASCSFDISVWQFLAPLLVGGSVHIVPGTAAEDPWRLAEEIDRGGVTVWETVPILLGLMADQEASLGARRHPMTALRWVISNAEALPAATAERWQRLAPGVALMNTYGATECSDDVTHYRVPARLAPQAAPVALGEPNRGATVYVVDRRMRLVPPGTPGEIVLGGDGVGQGYLRRPGLTAARFVPDPFIERSGARCYLTGDLGRWTVDGALEFLGRVDHQVKVRGHRVEPEHAAAVLRRHPDVQDAAVIAVPASGAGTWLCAFVVSRAHAPSPSPAALRACAAAELPDYLVPAVITVIPSLPVTPNGKLDRRALEMRAREAAFVAPRGAVEAVIAEAAAEALGLERVGVHDDLIARAGGATHVVRLLARLRALFDQPWPLAALGGNLTVEAIARLVEAADGPIAPDAPLEASRDELAAMLEGTPHRPPHLG